MLESKTLELQQSQLLVQALEAFFAVLLEFDWRCGLSDKVVCVCFLVAVLFDGVVVGFHLAQNDLGKGERRHTAKQPIHVLAGLRADRPVLRLNLFRYLNRLLLDELERTLADQIFFRAHHEQYRLVHLTGDRIFVDRMIEHLVRPASNAGQRHDGRKIEHNQGNVRVSVVGLRDRFEAFLAGGVPELVWRRSDRLDFGFSN